MTDLTQKQSFDAPACAHLTVNWKTEQMPSGMNRGWWECKDCHHPFLPVPLPEFGAAGQQEIKQRARQMLEDIFGIGQNSQVGDAITISVTHDEAGRMSAFMIDRNGKNWRVSELMTAFAESLGAGQTPAGTPDSLCKHCHLKIYFDKTDRNPKWRHHGSNFVECFGDLETWAEPTSRPPAVPAGEMAQRIAQALARWHFDEHMNLDSQPAKQWVQSAAAVILRTLEAERWVPHYPRLNELIDEFQRLTRERKAQEKQDAGLRSGEGSEIMAVGSGDRGNAGGSVDSSADIPSAEVNTSATASAGLAGHELAHQIVTILDHMFCSEAEKQGRTGDPTWTRDERIGVFVAAISPLLPAPLPEPAESAEEVWNKWITELPQRDGFSSPSECAVAFAKHYAASLRQRQFPKIEAPASSRPEVK